MAKYCLPGLDVAHIPTLGHQTSKQLICPKDPDCLHVPKPDPCKVVGPVKALSCVPGYVLTTFVYHFSTPARESTQSGVCTSFIIQQVSNKITFEVGL